MISNTVEILLVVTKISTRRALLCAILRRMPHAEQVKELLTPLLNELDDRGRNLIELRYGLTGSYLRTLEEIGEQLRITREKVRRIERQTLDHLSEAGRPLLFSAIVQEAAEIREALIEEHSGVRPEDLPSRFGSPWRDLAITTCDLATGDWLGLCLGHGSDPASG